MSVEVHVLASGSDGNCTVIRSEGRAFMIDAGLSFKKIKSFMDLNGIDDWEIEGLLITHEHTDHILGAATVSKRLDIPVICNDNTFNASHLGDVSFRQILMMNTFEVAGMRVIALPTSHDAIEPCSYLTEAEGKKVLLATDTGKMTYPVEHALEEADIAIVESNYDKKMLDYGPYPVPLKRRIDSDIGHLSNIACGEAISRTSTDKKRKLFLAHLSKKNNILDIARETVSQIAGIRRSELDCLEFQGDTRVLRV